MTILKHIYIGIGKRKTSIDKIYLIKGSGKIILNNRPLTNINLNANKNINILAYIISHIYEINNIFNLYNTYIQVKGGGISSQIGAISLALSKAICKIDIKYRVPLKRQSYLTCDSRIKERRKYGLKKARKAPQFTKR
jgi:small subunit ribosomal protein S9